MKTVVIWSSPNKDGLTATIKNEFISGLREGGNIIEDIHLNSKKIEHCRACNDGWGTCRTKGTCIFQDDFSNIYDIMQQADGIVFVSAVYWSDMTECMKAFMDRLRRIEATHNYLLANKRCILIACAGGTGRGTIECLQHMELCLTHMNMRAYDRISINRYNSDYMIPAMNKAGLSYADRLRTGFDMYY